MTRSPPTAARRATRLAGPGVPGQGDGGRRWNAMENAGRRRGAGAGGSAPMVGLRTRVARPVDGRDEHGHGEENHRDDHWVRGEGGPV